MATLPLHAEKKVSKLVRKAQLNGKVRSYVKEMIEFASAWAFAEQLVALRVTEVYLYDVSTRDHGATYAKSSTNNIIMSSSVGYNTRVGLNQVKAEKIYLSLDESHYNHLMSTSVLGTHFTMLFGCAITNRTPRTNTDLHETNVARIDLERLRALLTIWKADAAIPTTTKEAVAIGVSPFTAREFIPMLQKETSLLLGGSAIVGQSNPVPMSDNEIMFKNLMELANA